LSDPNPGFKVMVLFKAKYLKTAYFRDKVTVGNRQAIEWF